MAVCPNWISLPLSKVKSPFVSSSIMIFKKASLKIMARDTTTASTGGQDVKPMHGLIAAEKAVLLSLQKLSVDYTKAAEALRTWGKQERDDLGGILTASTTLLNHFSLALSQYAAHGHTMQRQLETMSTRGDSLDTLKQRRDTAHRKAEDTANQLSKMDPENKYFAMHTDALKRLRKDVRKMDADIKAEDAAFGDFKRTATKVWLNLKFGGLQDCCDRGAIAGKFGKLAAFEMSEDGTARKPYSPTKVDNLVAEADRHVHGVGHSTVRSREGTIQERPVSPTGSYFSVQTINEESSPPLLPPKPPSPHSSVNYHQTTQPFHASNDHFSERPDSFQSSSSGHPYAPSHGTSVYSLHDPPVGGGRPIMGSTYSESIPGSQSDRFPTSSVQTLSPVSMDSGGYELSGRPSFSAGNSHLQDNRPPGPSHPRGYALRDPPSVGGQTSGSLHRQNLPSDRYPTYDSAGPPPPAPARPTESGRYPQDPRHPNPPSDPLPVPSRHHASSESGRYLQDPRHTSDSSYRTAPSHWQGSPSDQASVSSRHPGSSDSSGYLRDPPPLRARNGDPSLYEAKTQWQNPAPRPPDPSGSLHRYPGSSSSGGSHRVVDSSFSAGPSHSPNSMSDRSPLPPRPLPSASKSQKGPVIMSPPDTLGYDPRTLGAQQSGGPSSSQWANSTNPFNGGSESTLPRSRESTYWGGGPLPSADEECPPAYMLENQESSSSGHSVPPAPGPNSNGQGRWERMAH